ncbi:SDR family NAD(P)-dependent oxidoreductase [Azospirillum sp. sgz302134]
MMTRFARVTLSAVTLSAIQSTPGIARATLRAGGIALLDAELCPADAVPAAAEHLGRLLRDAAPDAAGRIALRLAADQTETHAALLDRLAGTPHPLVLCGWRGGDLAGLLCALDAPGRSLWLEVTASDDLDAVDPALPVTGWLGRGSECGGRSGREAAFILCQRLARQKRPFWIQGGIGPYSAAACRAAGAAGVVLDDALLLLRESPLPAHQRALLGGLGVEDTVALGAEWGAPCRVADHAAFPAARALRRRAAEIAETVAETERPAAWRAAVAGALGWGEPDRAAWPLGQGAGWAATVAERHGTVGRLIRAVLETSERSIATAARLRPLEADGPLARSHGTRYPIVQGPMTRVSDRVPFALSVADGGALPMLALSVMSGAQAGALLEEAKHALGSRPWGVGMLGYLPEELWQAQVEAVAKARPPLALIAGGRPDHAARLEELGTATYLHVPTPRLLRMFLDQGAKRFIFEGSECGGHIGPLHGFALWSAAVDVLLAQLPPSGAEGVHVLFAGGIHDARSAAMVAALAAPLAERGVSVGVLMGTAYLFTAEAVEGGAILPGFQGQAMACRSTAVIETRPGHRIRCAPTPFLDAFAARGRALRAEGVAPAEQGDALERMVAGRLRLAAKGLERRTDGLHPVDEAQQRAGGLYMLGELAVLRDAPVRCADLHEDVSAGGTDLLADLAEGEARRKQPPTPRPAPPPVAIVGIGCVLPRATDPETLWRNLLDKVDVIREIPRDRFDWRLYYDPDPAARDRIYARWGGFIDPIPFDPLHFGIPPKSLPSIALPQLLGLEVTRRALRDAGFGDAIAEEALRKRTAVIVGAASTGDLQHYYQARSSLPLCTQPGEDAYQRLPEWSEESQAGILVNVIAGRIANRFDLGGPNFTVDAACASSLAALDLAVRELQTGGSDMALAGGVELEGSPHAFMAFSKTGALSATGKARVFDEGADGIVLSEGAVMLVLKRLADAERDGDRVYAVIRSVAGSSDGKGMGLTAPKPAGQVLALDRAYAQAGVEVASLGLYEAHGTGTKVGDRAELETFTTALRAGNVPPRSCAVGSAKSLLGHTRAAAGLTGLVKAALALHHRTLPPHAGVDRPLEALRDPLSPVHLLDTARPWLARPGQPRRAGVSAFGFGGTNFHAVLEGYDDDGAALGADDWPCELFVLAAADSAGLAAGIDRLIAACDAVDGDTRLRDLSFRCAMAARDGGPLRLAVVAADAADLRQKLTAARDALDKPAPLPGVFFSRDAVPGDVAFLFPGQGSQHPGMGGELALYRPEMRAAFEQAGEALCRLILPPAAFDDEESARQEKDLADTRIAQPAIAVVSCGLLDSLRRLGVEPARVAGHSFGEFVALHAAGAIDRDGLLRLAEMRGRLMAGVGPDAGTMGMAALTRAELEPYLDGVADVRIANGNAPRQQVLSGATEAVQAVLERLRADGHTVRKLTVSGAFHSPLMRPAREPFARFVTNAIEVAAPRLPVHANLDGAPYPADAASIRARWVEHLEQPVDFVAQIEGLYAASVRLFLELGPGRVLTGLVRQTLGDRPHHALSADGGLRPWLEAVAQLYVRGAVTALDALFENRPVRLPGQLMQTKKAPGWMMDGGRVFRAGEPGLVGSLPFLDADSPPPAMGIPGALPAASGNPIAAVYGEYQETMRRFLDQQERVLAHLLGGGAGLPAAPAPAPAAPAVVEAPPSPRAVPAPEAALRLDREALMAETLRLVSDRTGYPAEVLDPKQDLEAELGVDSIKRIEILGRLVATLPEAVAERVQKRFNRLTRAKSLNDIVDALMREASASDGGGSLRITVGEAPAGTAGESACPRFVMRGTPKPLPALKGARLGGLYLVTEDALGVADRLAVELRRHGAYAALVRRADLADPDAIAQRVLVLRELHGPVRGLVHLAGLGFDAEADRLASWREATALSTKALFHLVQCCADDLDRTDLPMHLVAATRLGGDWGRGGTLPESPAAGGSHGILRSLEREYPHLVSKTVDFEDAATAETIAARLLDELLMPGGGEEVGYAQGRRLMYMAEPAPLPANAALQDWRPAEGWVVLVTGGARGITAEIARELARPGVRLVLVGRAGNDAPEDVLRQREEALDGFRKAGAEVEYHGLDVRSEEAFGGLIDDLYRRHGRIDAVVHGAGVIEDQKFTAKAPDSFDRVFDTKADSAWILSRRLRPEGLKWVVLFGSIAGRFGNQGQADYAAANETMNRLAHRMNARWPDTRVVTINWGPWSGTGMASGGGVRFLLEAQGILPIDPEAGRRFFVEELSHGTKADAEVIAGRGPWGQPSNALLSSVFEASVLLLQMRELTERIGEAG